MNLCRLDFSSFLQRRLWFQYCGSGSYHCDYFSWVGISPVPDSVLVLYGCRLGLFLFRREKKTGVYRLVRCPNYFGEIILWTGCFVSGIGASLSVWQWLIASVGYLGIVFVMFSGARRLEQRQNSVYGNNPEYLEYVKNTYLLPFVPLYSVAKYKFLVA